MRMCLFFMSSILSIGCGLLAACTEDKDYGMSIEKEQECWFDGKRLEMFRLRNKHGMSVKVTNYAASLTYISVPDKKGRFAPVILGFDSLQSYTGKHPKFGATIGRYANRIRNGEIEIDGIFYPLEKNNKSHSIHGGSNGFHRQVFTTDTCYVCRDTATVAFTYTSPHLEGGFPGNMTLRLSYRLTNSNEIILNYTATTDRPTVVNFTNHAYFNLNGCKAPVLGYIYEVLSDSITEIDATGIPTGLLLPVCGTRYDFTIPHSIEEQDDKAGKGYDINYKLRNGLSAAPRLAAKVIDPVSGRVLKVFTTEPGMQFYIPESDMSYLTGHDGNSYGRYYGFCLETQHFPDSPHHPQFPSTMLRSCETYRQTTIYRFETLQ